MKLTTVFNLLSGLGLVLLPIYILHAHHAAAGQGPFQMAWALYVAVLAAYGTNLLLPRLKFLQFGMSDNLASHTPEERERILRTLRVATSFGSLLLVVAIGVIVWTLLSGRTLTSEHIYIFVITAVVLPIVLAAVTLRNKKS